MKTKSITEVLKLHSCILVLDFLTSNLASSQYLKSSYESQSFYIERYRLDSPYNLCRDPLMRRSNVSATSEASQRTALMATLWGGSAWTGNIFMIFMFLFIYNSHFLLGKSGNSSKKKIPLLLIRKCEVGIVDK